MGGCEEEEVIEKEKKEQKEGKKRNEKKRKEKCHLESVLRLHVPEGGFA